MDGNHENAKRGVPGNEQQELYMLLLRQNRRGALWRNQSSRTPFYDIKRDERNIAVNLESRST